MSSSHNDRISSDRIVTGAGINAALTLLSRILGFVRDLLVARLFGSSQIADAFFVAYRIPNLLRSFVAEGALTSAFVPIFSEEVRVGHESSRKALREISAFLLILTTLLTLLGIVFSPLIVRLFAPGFFLQGETGGLCIILTRIMFPYIIFVSFIALIGGALNTLHHYGAAAWSQVVMNLVLIVGALIAGAFSPEGGVLILALSVILGGLVQVLVQLPALSRLELSILPHFRCWTRTTRSVLALMLPATIGSAVYQVTMFLGTVFASLMTAGSVSWLFYADRVTQLPIGIFTVALGVVMLPVLSRARAANDHAQFISRLSDSLRLTSFTIIPISCFLYVTAENVVSLLFERGAFTSTDTFMTALAVKGICIGLWSVSCHSMLTRAFLANKQSKTITLIGIIGLCFYFIFTLHLIGPIIISSSDIIGSIIIKSQRALTIDYLVISGGHLGLVISSALSATVSFVILAVLAIIKFSGFSIIETARAAICASISSIGIFVSAYILNSSSWYEMFPPISKLAILAITSLISYILIQTILKNRELSELKSIFYRLLLKLKK